MKKYLIFSILSLLFLLPLPAEAVKKMTANPINVAYMLAQVTDTVKIVKTLSYYGYQYKQLDNGFTIYCHPNGAIIRYSFDDDTATQPYPKVEVKSNISTKEIEKILDDLQFKKEDSLYQRKISQYARTVFNCKQGNQGFWIFNQIKIP